MLNFVTIFQILPTGFTDRSLVVLSFKLPLSSGGSAYWTLNTRLVSDKKKFKDCFKAVWEKKSALPSLSTLASGCGGTLQNPK